MSAPYPLVAEDPTTWMERHLTSYFRYYRELVVKGEASALRVLSLDDLLDDGGGGALRERFEGELTEGWPPQAGLTGVVGAFAGGVAGLVGYAAFASGAHWIVSPEDVRWLVDDDGWPVAVKLVDHRTVVPPDHPWATLPGALVEPDAAVRAQRCLGALVGAVAPIIDRARTFTKVGRAGLWNSVVDAFGHAIMYQEAFPVERRHVDVVRQLVGTLDQPWKARPDLRAVSTDLGEVCVAQRGGCCLVYTATWPDADDDHHEDDELHARFYAEFTDPPEAPGYCNDCSLRSADDCFARLVWWRTEELKLRLAGCAT